MDNHSAAEDAVKELQKSGFDMKKLSVVGKDYHTDEQVVGYYNAGDRMKYWGKLGALRWGLLFGAAFFWVPAIGPVLVGGPLAAWIVTQRKTRWYGRRLECHRCRSVSIGMTKATVS